MRAARQVGAPGERAVIGQQDRIVRLRETAQPRRRAPGVPAVAYGTSGTSPISRATSGSTSRWDPLARHRESPWPPAGGHAPPRRSRAVGDRPGDANLIRSRPAGSHRVGPVRPTSTRSSAVEVALTSPTACTSSRSRPIPCTDTLPSWPAVSPRLATAAGSSGRSSRATDPCASVRERDRLEHAPEDHLPAHDRDVRPAPEPAAGERRVPALGEEGLGLDGPLGRRVDHHHVRRRAAASVPPGRPKIRAGMVLIRVTSSRDRAARRPPAR